jgi:hypothetical protein
MKNIQVVPAAIEHGILLASDLLPAYERDLETGWGKTAGEAIREAIEASDGGCWAILTSGRVAGIFGAVGDGNVWIITGRAFEDDRLAYRFVRRSGEYIEKLLNMHHRLYGYINLKNTRMISWLKWSGFDMTDLGNGYARCEKCAPR